MEGFRIANFVLQSAFLVGQLAFIVFILRRSQPTPVWRWFSLLNIAFWLWVAGRFMETIVYLFFPGNGEMYLFAAYFQYIGDTSAGIAFAVWNLHIAGYGKLASHPLFLAVMAVIPLGISALAFTNDLHHLLYAQLEMGPYVVHGPLFLPCFILVALIVLAGYAVAVSHIVRTGRDKAKRLVVFSLYPALPFGVSLIRTASGIDQVDFTPLALAVSVACLYLIVFKHNYAKIIPSSVASVLEQTVHPICVYDLSRGEVSYANRAAQEGYGAALREIAPLLHAGAGQFEGRFDGKFLRVDATPLPQQSALLVTATDLTDVVQQRTQLDEQIAELQLLSEALNEENRNIDAYLDSLDTMQAVQAVQAAGEGRDLVSTAYDNIDRTLETIQGNLYAAKADLHEAAAPLEDNLRLAQDCIVRIRATVAQLREAS